MVFYTLVLQFYLKNEQKKKGRWYLSKKKKVEEKQNIPTIMISADGKRAVFPVKLSKNVNDFIGYGGPHVLYKSINRSSEYIFLRC